MLAASAGASLDPEGAGAREGSPTSSVESGGIVRDAPVQGVSFRLFR